MVEFLSSDYVEERARHILPKAIFEFISGGADNETTLAANRDEFHAYRLRPRVLRDVSNVETSITLFGHRRNTPLFVAPMGSHQLMAAAGELATAQAASATDVGYITSTAASYSLEEVGQIDGLGKWFQLYCFKDRMVTADLIARAEAAGYEALVITVDAPVLGMRRRDLRNEFVPDPHIRWANLERYGIAGLPESTTGTSVLDYFVEQIDATVTWDDRSLTRGDRCSASRYPRDNRRRVSFGGRHTRGSGSRGKCRVDRATDIVCTRHGWRDSRP